MWPCALWRSTQLSAGSVQVRPKGRLVCSAGANSVLRLDQVKMMRIAIAVFILLVPRLSGAQFGKPPRGWVPPESEKAQEQVQEKAQEQAQEQNQNQTMAQDAQVASQTYKDQVRELAKEIATERAKKLSWIYFPTEVNWVGLAVYFGNDWQLRISCDAGRQCMPHMGIAYGAEGFLNPFASLDLVVRIGGASQFTDGFNTRHGLDTSALVRWRIAGVVPILLGWRMIGTPYQQVGEDGKSVVDALTYSHYGYVGAGFRFRGATAEIGVSVGAHNVLGMRSIDEAKNTFSTFATLRLVTPALVGF